MWPHRKKEWYEDHEKCRKMREALLKRKKLKRLKIPPIVSGSHRISESSLERALERTQEIEMDDEEE